MIFNTPREILGGLSRYEAGGCCAKVGGINPPEGVWETPCCLVFMVSKFIQYEAGGNKCYHSDKDSNISQNYLSYLDQCRC